MTPHPSMLALGDTASVMPSLAQVMDGLYVAFPTNVTSVVLQRNEKCIAASPLNYPLSVTCYRFIKEMSARFSLFHAELGYAPACQAAGVEYGVHLHGVTDIDLLFPKSHLGGLLKTRYREALRGASYVVCHPAVLEKALRLRPDAVAMPMPIDTGQFNERVPRHAFEGDFPIFSPSRMDQWKGHDLIWEALSLMRNRDRAVVYQSDWGWEPRYSYLKQHAPPNVRFIPLVPRQEMASYYAGACIVLGQMQIGEFGMTELEAAACGAPVLAYLKDPETPFVPKRRDAKSLAEAIDALIDDPKGRREYARRCRSYVLERTDRREAAYLLSRVVASGDRPRPHQGRGIDGLFWGSGFEIVGRAIGERPFSRLKASLIGL